MGDKSAAEIARLMFEAVGPSVTNRLKRNDVERLLAHDPSDPFSSTHAEIEDFTHKIHLNFAGNCARVSGRQIWIGDDGQAIDIPRGLTSSWALERAEELAGDLGRFRPTVRVAHGGKHKHPKEHGDIIVNVPDHDRYGTRAHLKRPPGVIDTHYLTLNVLMQDISGKLAVRTFRTDSIGRKDIGQRIHAHLERLEQAMPRNPEEALEQGLEHVRKVYTEAFDAHLIEPAIKSIERDRGTNGLAFTIIHTMHDTLLQPKDVRDQIRFYGMDPINPWKASASAFGSGLAHANLAAEAGRRKNVEINGGLTQTSLTKNVIELAGMEPVPIKTEYNGSAKTERFSLQTTPASGGTMQVKNGRIETELTIGRHIRITTGTFKMEDDVDLPEAVVASFKGRKLRSIIDHPAIGEDIVITSAQLKGRSLHARIRMDTVKVEEPAH